MTYKEAYAKIETLDTLKEMVKIDMLYATLVAPDKIEEINKAVTATLEEKGWEWVDNG